MLITPSNLSFFFTTLNTTYWQAYQNAPVFYDKIATVMPTSSETHGFGWIGMLNRMREWKDSRLVHSPAPQTYFVTPKLFELTEGIDRLKLEDDTYGLYYPTIAFMGENTKKWPDWELRDLLQNTGAWTGSYQLGTDQLTHWNTAHPVDFYDASKGTYCNDFTGGGFTVNGILTGGALGLNSFATLWQEIASRKSESGEAMGLMADQTVMAPQLKLTADTILNSQFMAQPAVGNLVGNVGATENMLKGWTDRLMWNDLAPQPSVWYMLVSNRPIKPFVWLLRQAPTLIIRNQPTDPHVFDLHEYLYGSDARGAPAWGLPFLSARSGP
jgi:phage major head subunit gpT-like protein